MSRPSVDLPSPGRPATTISWPGCRPLVRRVEVGEAGRDAGHRAGPAADGLHLVHRRLHDVAEDGVVLAGAPLGDVVDRLLGPVDEVVDLAAVGGVAQLHDPGAGLDQAAQDGPLGHDPGVVAGVGRGGHAGQQRVQVGRAADAGHVAGAGQLAGRRSPRRPARPGRTGRGRCRRSSGAPAGRSRSAGAPRRRRRSRPCSAACRRAPTARPRRPAAGSARTRPTAACRGSSTTRSDTSSSSGRSGCGADGPGAGPCLPAPSGRPARVRARRSGRPTACGRPCGQGVGTRARRCGALCDGAGDGPGSARGQACHLPTCCAQACGRRNPGTAGGQQRPTRVLALRVEPVDAEGVRRRSPSTVPAHGAGSVGPVRAGRGRTGRRRVIRPWARAARRAPCRSGARRRRRAQPDLAGHEQLARAAAGRAGGRGRAGAPAPPGRARGARRAAELRRGPAPPSGRARRRDAGGGPCSGRRSALALLPLGRPRLLGRVALEQGGGRPPTAGHGLAAAGSAPTRAASWAGRQRLSSGAADGRRPRARRARGRSRTAARRRPRRAGRPAAAPGRARD